MEHPAGLLIGGEWRGAPSWSEVRSPWDNAIVGRVGHAGPEQVDAAVRAAEHGFELVAGLPAAERARILRRASALVAERRERFAAAIIAESGKPRRHAAAEVGRAVETLRLSAEEAGRLHGETVPLDAAPGSARRRGYFIRVPLGVVGAITPFNFPLNLVCHKVGPALAAGNSVVLKPASATPLSALLLGHVFIEAGLPPGALNIVTGPGPAVGLPLVRDTRVRLITFTGSAAVGETIRTESGLRRTALELGANCGAIVDETANLDAALERCLAGGFAYSGQVCIHTQRLYLHESVAEEFTCRFVERARALACGDPADPTTEVGPMINRAAVEAALELVRGAVEAGAELLCGGTAENNLMHPTVLARVGPELPVVCEETFAPVVTVETFKDFDSGLAMFNRGSSAGTRDYGLACGVFTSDLNRALRATEWLAVGNVYVNDSATFRADLAPYGGVRDSGMGREGPRFAVEEMTDIRMVSFNLGD